MTKKRDQRKKCPREGCDRILSSYKGLYTHLKAHDRIKKCNITKSNNILKHNTYIFKCMHPNCIKLYTRRDYLYRHINIAHKLDSEFINNPTIEIEILI